MKNCDVIHRDLVKVLKGYQKELGWNVQSNDDELKLVITTKGCKYIYRQVLV
jgi:hypothetical protein